MAAQGAQIVAEGHVAATARQGQGRVAEERGQVPCVSPKSEQSRWSKAAADAAAAAAAVGGQEGSGMFSAPRSDSDSDPGLAGLACLSPRLVLM